MASRAILWGMWACLALLAMEVALLAMTRSWVALAVTVLAVGGVAAATAVTVRRRQ
jgi:hypothetical protein